MYWAATRDTPRLGGRDEVVAKAGFTARKRPSGKKQKLPESLQATEQPEVKKQKLPKSLQASVHVRRADKFAQVRAAVCRKFG